MRLFRCPWGRVLLLHPVSNPERQSTGSERRPGCCCHQGKRVAGYASPHDPVWTRSLASLTMSQNGLTLAKLQNITTRCLLHASEWFRSCPKLALVSNRRLYRGRKEVELPEPERLGFPSPIHLPFQKWRRLGPHDVAHHNTGFDHSQSAAE